MQVVGKTERACFRRLAVIGDAFVIVRGGGATGKENPVMTVGAAAGDAEARRAGMRWQPGPFNLVGILLSILPSQHSSEGT
jgi:hypothetical protein